MAEIRTQRPPNLQTSNPKQVATVTWERGHHPENDGVCFSTTGGPESGCAVSPSGYCCLTISDHPIGKGSLLCWLCFL
ncbi:hypothetical protein EPR50_G00105460 [Perca flavescens]|uniref:Uncharacterized protein n=1 Tax=Perca flavescens TaxID=8167 RepID=A0A484CWR5_PERFV|nr:hypothetical protein EPR50_G00105460 [Perca flavescens]